MSENARKLTLATAVVILCIVWGRNFVLLGEASQTVLDVQSAEGLVFQAPEAEEAGSFEYQNPYRDPFEVPVTRKRIVQSQPSNQPTQPETKPSPQAAYRGVVWTKTKPQVIVFDSLRNATRIIGQGDTLNSFLLSSISPERIVFQSGRHRTVWNREDAADK